MKYFFIILSLTIFYSCKKVELSKEVINPDFLYINTTDDCEQLYAPLSLRLIAPVLNYGDSIKWSLNNETIFGSDIIKRIETDVNINYDISMEIIKKNKDKYKESKKLSIKPAPDTISIDGVSVVLMGVQDYEYDFPNYIDSLGRPDVYAELYDMNGKKLPVNLSPSDDYLNNYKITWMFNKPIYNWPIKDKIEIRVFDFDSQTNTSQQIGSGKVNFINIIDFTESKYYKNSTKCSDRFPSKFLYKQEQETDIKTGLETTLIVTWKF